MVDLALIRRDLQAVRGFTAEEAERAARAFLRRYRAMEAAHRARQV